MRTPLLELPPPMSIYAILALICRLLLTPRITHCAQTQDSSSWRSAACCRALFLYIEPRPAALNEGLTSLLTASLQGARLSRDTHSTIALAQLTGKEEHVLTGQLLIWRPELTNTQLAVADNVHHSLSKGKLKRYQVVVVTRDGASHDALCYCSQRTQSTAFPPLRRNLTGSAAATTGRAVWEAERELDTRQAAQLIGARFPELRPVTLSLLGQGWDNSVFLVNKRYAFRFPRRALAVELLANELKALRVFSSLQPPTALSLKVPAPLFDSNPQSHTTPHIDSAWPFAGYDFLPGCVAARANLTRAQRIAIASPLAQFLREMHSLPASLAEACGLPADLLDRLNSVKRALATKERLAELEHAGLISSTQHLRAQHIIDTAPNPLQLDQKVRVIVHGDLHAAQVLVDGENRLTAVIDWGDVHVGHPATDWAVAHAMLPPQGLAVFRAIYGPIDELGWKAARARATWHSVALAAYAHARGAFVMALDVFLKGSFNSAEHRVMTPVNLLPVTIVTLFKLVTLT
eukprot:g36707.t1